MFATPIPSFLLKRDTVARYISFMCIHDVQAFFAEIYREAKRATPGEGHRALAAIERSGKLQRHYTLNVDGLAAAVGLSTWHPTSNPQGGAR